jgi:hypothetical protein
MKPTWITVTDEMAHGKGTHLFLLVQKMFEQGYVTYDKTYHEAVGQVYVMCTVKGFMKKMEEAIEQRNRYMSFKAENERDHPDEIMEL